MFTVVGLGVHRAPWGLPPHCAEEGAPGFLSLWAWAPGAGLRAARHGAPWGPRSRAWAVACWAGKLCTGAGVTSGRQMGPRTLRAGSSQR